ncbi:hypothetical protein [Shimazuella alba]|uniref:Uncharacterized protein n=1 Tax=Shimazuella alba TaxID=2690964 RepID=A0A6I4W157_9BACL|nr:hypothetical protein [Shimazuella alba]MXQ55726.1 hypothetical protein [Shimazuella alba]
MISCTLKDVEGYGPASGSSLVKNEKITTRERNISVKVTVPETTIDCNIRGERGLSLSLEVIVSGDYTATRNRACQQTFTLKDRGLEADVTVNIFPNRQISVLVKANRKK